MTTTDTDSDDDPLDQLRQVKRTAEHYTEEAQDDPAVPDRYAGAFERTRDQLADAGGAIVTVDGATYEHLDHATTEGETHDDAIARLLSAVPGPNEWVCRHCGADICPADEHHETNDLVIWQLQVEGGGHYRPDPFCSQRCFREEIAELLPGMESDR
jgi:hypothetical protein